MNTFGSELILHILSFLPGKDVVRFKRLASIYKKFVVIQRCYLRYPCITVYAQHSETRNVELKKIDISIKLGHKILSRGRMDFSNTSATVFNPSQYLLHWHPPFAFDETRLEKDVFLPFYNGEFNLKDFFLYIMDIGDLDLDVKNVRNSHFFAILTDAVNESSSSQVVGVSSRPDYESFDESYNLLVAVAHRKRQRPGRPKMSMYCIPREIEEHWPRLRKLNDIASLYRIVRLDIRFEDIDSIMTDIAKKWTEDGYPKLHFGLHVNTHYDYIGKRHFGLQLDIIDDEGNDTLLLKNLKTGEIGIY